MIRLITCIRRPLGMTEQQFDRIWDDPVTREAFDKAVAALQPVKFVRQGNLRVPLNEDLQRVRNSEEPFDAVMEWWWNTLEDFHLRFSSESGQEALRVLLKHQQAFVDLTRSPSFFTKA